MDELIGPEPGPHTIQAPGPITSESVTMIQGKQNLRSPPDRIGNLLPFQPAEGNPFSRNRIPHIQAQADAQQAQLGPSLHHPREKACQFAALNKQVIGPFDLNRKAPLLQSFHHRQCNCQAEQTGVARCMPLPRQRGTDPDTTGRGQPDTPPLANSPALMGGDHSAGPAQ